MGKNEIYKSESERPDQSSVLGKALSMMEKRCYMIIFGNGNLPISSEKIAKKLFSISEEDNLTTFSNKKNVNLLICRIRKKLGKEEIICRTGCGYLSRRALINDIVNESKNKQGLLTKQLDQVEERCYQIIRSSASSQITTTDVAKLFFKVGEINSREKEIMERIIDRIILKLGGLEIIKNKDGYLLNNELVNGQVEKNK